MTSDLSIFAARLREFISICAEESSFGVPSSGGSNEPALQAHHDAEFNGMALVLFALQFQHNVAYRTICEARKVAPDTISHWTQIPAVPTTAFKELDLTSLPPEARTNVFHSSGTTEQRPSRHFHSAESLAIYEASLWPWFQRHLRPDLTPDTWHLTLLSPPPTQAPHSSLVHMFELIRCKLGASRAAFAGEIDRFGSWALDFDRVRGSLRESMVEKRPLLLLGTAFSFVHLLDDLAKQDLRFELPPVSCVMETGGYKGRSRSLPKSELHALITQRLGIPATHIVCEYGMSELSSQAYDSKVSGVPPSLRFGAASRCPAFATASAGGQVSGLNVQRSTFNVQRSTNEPERVFRFPPWARAQVVSPETGREMAEGETGLLRIFDLANVFSVMAIQTEDLAVRRADAFELVGRAEASELRGCSLMIANSQ
jgi:Acyl-protein synthetase, LuxE